MSDKTETKFDEENQPAWRARFQHSVLDTYRTPKLNLVSGKGAYVVDSDGNQYLDFLAGIAVNTLGHAHPVVVDAIRRQAEFLHVSNYFASDSRIQLAEKLQEISGFGAAGRTYFANSGAEAIETAVKLALLNRNEKRRKFVALKDGFHGRTMGALALTGKEAYRVPFEPLQLDVIRIDPTLEDLEKIDFSEVTALFVETIRGEAGVRPIPAGFLARARELTEKHGSILAVDEIQTGVGRTGKWLSFQHEGVQPDVFTVAKGLAGGVPIGTMVVNIDKFNLYDYGLHGSTFGGNPLATTVGVAVLGAIEELGLVENAAKQHEAIKSAVESLNHPFIEEVRGRGLLIGIGVPEGKADAIGEAARKLGLIVNPANPSTIRLAPPLIIGDKEVAEFTDKFSRALDVVKNSEVA
ncbi:MAG: acetylornithine transaminase [Microbacteriaceae bacterium]|nr:acetylornithine transaminase [Microbacteriaceae bacterium]